MKREVVRRFAIPYKRSGWAPLLGVCVKSRDKWERWRLALFWWVFVVILSGYCCYCKWWNKFGVDRGGRFEVILTTLIILSCGVCVFLSNITTSHIDSQQTHTHKFLREAFLFKLSFKFYYSYYVKLVIKFLYFGFANINWL